MRSAEKCTEQQRVGDKCKEVSVLKSNLLIALYRAEAWGMRRAERKKENLLEMKCLSSLVRVSRMDRKSYPFG